MLRIFLVDDHQVVRTGFKQLLEMEPGWKVVGEAGSVAALADLMLHLQFDVMVLDLSLPDGDGLVVLRQVLGKRPDLPVVVMSMHEGTLYVQDAMNSGARAYVTKRSGFEELVEALKQVQRGETYVSMDVRMMSQSGKRPESNGLPELTTKEANVFLLLARGHSVSRVAATLNVSNKTVYSHRNNIWNKLSLASDFELRKLAHQRGLITE
ncbi:response regulator transcription factor [Lysobacter sp. HDW10]|jgi:two-component system uhpT operon response regulator UhpA|uniref:response regulator transcription factor n=1 Tax=Lysobacter sp. HDW10 TaxID=2714936 RepID=UPI00140BB58A|nr:response regulator transcription factor [Lysobacter sp. HDW10]QIK81757.1 response regulator transcription factor [Lysobacter sp. HDW10]